MDYIRHRASTGNIIFQEKISQSQLSRLHLYEAGLLELQHNSVLYSNLTTHTIDCAGDLEFLMKLHVLWHSLDVSLLTRWLVY